MCAATRPRRSSFSLLPKPRLRRACRYQFRNSLKLEVAMTDTVSSHSYEVVILGAGYAGLMAALSLAGRNPLSRIALVGESAQFVERIRLQEAVTEPVAPRLPPFAVLFAKSKVTFIRGRVEVLDAVN